MMYGSISVVVPVYNSENSIEELYCRLEKVLERTADKYEIIMVDDGSKDGSFIQMERLQAGGKKLRIIALEGNYGQQNAIMCGLRHASGEYVITIDDDLQYPPEEIPKLLIKLEEGFEVVYGIPVARKGYGARNIGTAAVDLFFTVICFKPRKVKVGSFRAMRRQVVQKIIKEDSSFVYITAITLKHTKNIGNAVVAHEERKYGSSNYNFCKLGSLFFRLVVNYSGLPLRKPRRRAPQYIINEMRDPI